ncbi:unnamed protein product [Merluccius merluccius]
MDSDHIEPIVDTKTALHSWRYSHHFTHKADQGKNVIVQCNLCLPKVNLLSTSKTSTSNLKKHLNHSHKTIALAEHCIFLYLYLFIIDT